MSSSDSYFPFSARARLLTAAVVWSVVGLGLAAAGTRWLLRPGGGGGVPVLFSAGLLGWAKGRFILAPRARANAKRIASSSGPVSIVGVFSPATWALVAGMMGTGYVLRHSGLPPTVLGWIYATAGAGLIVGAAPAWRAWARFGEVDSGTARGSGGAIP